MADYDWRAARRNWLKWLDTNEPVISGEIKAAYKGAMNGLNAAARDLRRELDAAVARGEVVDAASVRRLAAWERYTGRVAEEYTVIEDALHGVVNRGLTPAAEAGANAARRLTMAAARDGDEIARLWNRPNPKALQAMADALSDQLIQQIGVGKFANASSQKVADLILAGMAQGYNPRRTAAIAAQAYNVPLTWALAHARTSQIYAYRLGTHEGYKANPAIVGGWIWMAACDARTCISCWSKHGTKHPHTEVLNDHHLGRCAPAPDLAGGLSKFTTVETGAELFRRLSADEQRAIMGKTVWNGWQAGRVDFGSLSRTYNDPVYGIMQRAPSARELGLRRAG